MSDETQESRNALRKMFNEQESGRFVYDTYISLELAGDFACSVLKMIEFREAALREELASARRDVERYHALRKVTPYRFKKMQDASVTDGGDILYFHADRFDVLMDIELAQPTESGASE